MPTSKIFLNSILLLLLAASLGLSGCELFQPPEPDEPEDPRPQELPPVTTTGEGTFGFHINDQLWLPGEHDYPVGVYDATTGYLRLFAQDQEGDEELGISLYNQVFDTGTYALTPGPAEVAFYAGTGSPFQGIYRIDSTHHGTLTILRVDDERPFVVSGTFEFEAVNEAGEVIQVTDGRFDFNHDWQ